MTGQWNGIIFNPDEPGAIHTFRRVSNKAEIPPLHFKPEWDVRIIPPFGGAMMRFTVDHNGRHVSVYCDFFEMLGFYGEPYWEMYPRSYGDSIDVMRFPLADTEGLIRNIDEELNGVAMSEEGAQL